MKLLREQARRIWSSVADSIAPTLSSTSPKPDAPACPPPECEWCGEAHAREALCQARPKWSRRGFLALLGTGAAGLVLADKLPGLAGEAYVAEYRMFWQAGVRAGKTRALTFEMLQQAADRISEGTYRHDYFIVPRESVQFVEAALRGEWVETDGRILTRRNDGSD